MKIHGQVRVDTDPASIEILNGKTPTTGVLNFK